LVGECKIFSRKISRLDLRRKNGAPASPGGGR
jgi:hypothetical protein